MCRYDDDFQPVNLLKLEGFRIRRAGHTGKIVIEPEVILERDRRDGLVLLLDRDALLRLDSLVQPIRPAATRHGPTRELVDDNDITVLDDVLHVLLKHRVRTQRRVQVV